MIQPIQPRHKQPLDQTPSGFVLSCLAHHSIVHQGNALDLACGYGRHTNILRSKGYSVVSGDLSIDSLKVIKQDFLESNCVCLDASADLPFCNNIFNLVLVVHYVHKTLISRITRLMSPGGFLIYETYGGQGLNWQSLPIHGEFEDQLTPNFSIIQRKVITVGPKDTPRVILKIFAKKQYE